MGGGRGEVQRTERFYPEGRKFLWGKWVASTSKELRLFKPDHTVPPPVLNKFQS